MSMQICAVKVPLEQCCSLNLAVRHRVRKTHWARIISAATEYDTAITLAQLEDANRKVTAQSIYTSECDHQQLFCRP